MKRFLCPCGSQVYFDNTTCLQCGRKLGFEPGTRDMVELGDSRFRACANYLEHCTCNWLVAADEDQALCRSCRLTRTTPNLSTSENVRRWAVLESAKRRLLYSILDFDLPLDDDTEGSHPPLAFEFLEDKGSNPLVAEEYVRTGYATGVITINVSEANPAQREQARSLMNEDYRTPLGHLRHESGHYYFDRLVRHSHHQADFKALFGDPDLDYEAALERYYANPPPPAPDLGFISQYARSHPLEDWAECWAHFLHIHDTMESACDSGILEQKSLESTAAWAEQWQRLSVILNELNRCMGHRDAYPFVLSPLILSKLDFIDQVVCRRSPS